MIIQQHECLRYGLHRLSASCRGDALYLYIRGGHTDTGPVENAINRVEDYERPDERDNA